MPENTVRPDANELMRRLTADLAEGRITYDEMRERLKADAERPLDSDMLRVFCDAYEKRVETYGAMLQTIGEIATDPHDLEASRQRETEVDRHMEFMNGKLPLWREQLKTVFEFLAELRASSGQGPVRLLDLSHSTAHLLAVHIIDIATEGWRRCRETAHRRRSDPRHMYAPSASALFLKDHMPSLPKPNDLLALTQLERFAATKVLRDGRPPQENLTSGVSIHTDTVIVQGQSVSLAAEQIITNASTGAPVSEEPAPSVSAEEAQRRAEAFIKLHDFPGVNVLAKQCGCSSSTMRKAIAQSEKLRQAQAAHELRKAKPGQKAQVVSDASWGAQVDEALRQLIEYAPASQRAKLNTPDMREQLAKMEANDLASLVDDAREQAGRRNRAADHGAGGRAGRARMMSS